MASETACLGIDGGGTGTRARLVAGDGRVLGEGQAGPATLRLGADASWRALMKAADAAMAAGCITPGHVHAAIGVAGLSRPGARDGLLARAHPFATLRIETDASMACCGAHAGDDGGIVIAGTGSIGFAVIAGRQVRVGGMGFPISDAGSGADIGLEAARWVLRARDGCGPPPAMAADVAAVIGHDEEGTAAWGANASPTDYAALVPIVVRHAEVGDAAATALLDAAARHIGTLIAALFAHGAPRVSLVGGLAPVLAPRLDRATHARLSPARGDAIDGALHYARVR